jgi:putative permease
MGVKFSFLLGLVAAATNIIPYIGPIIGMIPAIAWGLAEFGVSPTFGAILILYFVANAIDLAIVFPILVSKVVDLHPLVVVASVIFGSQSLGIMGMVISIPLAASLKLVILEVYFEVYSLSRQYN